MDDRPIFDNSGRADADFALPAFPPAWHSGADLQAAVVPLQIADLHSFGARGDKLVS